MNIANINGISTLKSKSAIFCPRLQLAAFANLDAVESLVANDGPSHYRILRDGWTLTGTKGVRELGSQPNGPNPHSFPARRISRNDFRSIMVCEPNHLSHRTFTNFNLGSFQTFHYGGDVLMCIRDTLSLRILTEQSR